MATSRVTILALPHCMASAVMGLADVFSIANLFARQAGGGEDAFATEIATPGGREIRAFNDFPIRPQRDIEAIVDTDLLIVAPVVTHLWEVLENQQATLAWLKDCYPKVQVMASVCTGAFVLAEAGLLNGKTATTNPAFARKFRERYPDVKLTPERALTEDGNVVCAGATTSYVHLAIHLVEKFAGKERAVQCGKGLLLDRSRIEQSPYFSVELHRQHGDEKVSAVQEYFEKNYAAALSIAEVARQVGMSERNLSRRFRSATGEAPKEYLQRLRIEAAKQDLEMGNRTLAEIVEAVGYDDLRSFSRLFKKLTTLSPSAYRERFASPLAGNRIS